MLLKAGAPSARISDPKDTAVAYWIAIGFGL